MTDFKYPAHSTEPYRAPVQPQNHTKAKPEAPVWLRYLFVCCAAVLLGGMCVGTMYLDERADKVSISASHVDTTVKNVAHIVPELHTNTAEPSETPEPSRTPYPTFTHTPTTAQNSAMVQNDNEIIYIKEYVEVTRIIEIMITATMQPATATLAPTWTPTPTYDAAAFAAKIERSKMVRYEMLAWVGNIFFSILVMTLVFLLSFSAIRSTIKYYIDKRREQLEAAPEAKQIPVNDVNRERRIIMYYKAGWSLRKIEEHVFGYTGGEAYKIVSDVIQRYNEQLITPPPHEDVPQFGST